MTKIMIAEDDFVIAELLRDVLESGGYEVCGIARTVADALALNRRHNPSLAIIDLHLADGGCGAEIVAQFGELRPAVLYTTGDTSEMFLTEETTACLGKPFGAAELLHSLEIVLDLMANGTTVRPLPRNFELLRRSLSTIYAQ